MNYNIKKNILLKLKLCLYSLNQVYSLLFKLTQAKVVSIRSDLMF